MHLDFGQLRYAFASISFAVGVGVMGHAAEASELSYETRATERLTFDDNILLSPNSPEAVFGSLTTLAADVAWSAPSRYWNFHSDVDFKRYFGPGRTDNLDAFNQNYSVKFHKEGRISALNLSSAFKVQDAALSELTDTGFTNEDTDRLTIVVKSDVSAKVNHTDRLTLSASAENVDFSDATPTLTPFLNLNLAGSWTRQINERTVFSTDFGWTHFDPENRPGGDSHTYRVSSRIDTKLREGLTMRIRGGASFRDDTTGGGAFDLTNTKASALAEFGLNYKLATTQLSFSATHDIEPSASGELQKRTRIKLGASEQINSRARVAITANFLHQASTGPAGIDRDFLSISPSYSILLSRKWSAAIGYSFKLEDEAGDIATSNGTYVSLTRIFSKKTCSAACTE